MNHIVTNTLMRSKKIILPLAFTALVALFMMTCAPQVFALDDGAGGIISGVSGEYEKAVTDRNSKTNMTVGSDMPDEENAAGEYDPAADADNTDAAPGEEEVNSDENGTVKPAIFYKAENDEEGVRLLWKYNNNDIHYTVYKRTSEDDSWEIIYQTEDNTQIRYTDTDVKSGQRYEYAVSCDDEQGKSVRGISEPVSIVYIEAPVPSIRKKTAAKKTISWNAAGGASGYEIQYALSRTFAGKAAKTIKGRNITKCTIKKLKKNKTYYARIRAYAVYDGQKVYSAWETTANAKKNITTSIAYVKYKKKTVNLRTAAGQGVYGNAIMQGGTTDGTYAYYALVDKEDEAAGKAKNARIVKQKLSSGKVVKVSAKLPLDHANAITYDSENKRLVVTHNTTNRKRVSFVDPAALKVTGYKDIEIPSKLPGATKAQRSAIKGFAFVTYNKTHNQYVAGVSTVHDHVILDSDFNPVEYVEVSSKYENTNYQGADSMYDYVVIAESPGTGKMKYNVLAVYDWEGNLNSTIRVSKSYEIENVFHTGSNFYTGFYRSYYVKGKLRRADYTFKTGRW